MEFGVDVVHNVIPPSKKGGRQVEEFLLNEEQATYLALLMKNSPKVVKFKMRLNKEFFRLTKILAKILAQKQNAEWLEKRASGKIERKLETETIKKFVEYAKSQGSQSASKYYMAITKMENSSLFHLDMLEQKFPNLRDVLHGFQLSSLEMADHIVARALDEGMDKLMPYKEIYLLSKERVEQFVSIVGKTPIQVALNPQKMIRTDIKCPQLG